MAVPLASGLGRILISDEVISTVAGIAATECYGVVGMASRNLQDGIAELLRLENLHRGVEVRLEGEQVGVSLYVIVEYGVNISQVGRNVMEQVKHAVESLLGLQVAYVNVHVQGVRVNQAPISPAAEFPARKG